MKWINHLAIAGATTAVVNPALVPVALLGSTAPDWLEWVLDKLGHRVRHRTLTHIMLYWIGALAFTLLVWDFHGIRAYVRRCVYQPRQCRMWRRKAVECPRPLCKAQHGANSRHWESLPPCLLMGHEFSRLRANAVGGNA